MSLAGARKPLDIDALSPDRAHVVPVVIRSLVGERVGLSTAHDIHRIVAPKGAARLVDLNSFWGVASERVDFGPGDNWLTLQLHVGTAVVAAKGYRLHVPEIADDNGRFVLAAAPP